MNVLLSLNKFPGDEIPIIRGSSLSALNGTNDEFGRQAILNLIDVVDGYISDSITQLDKPFLMPIEDVYSIQYGSGTGDEKDPQFLVADPAPSCSPTSDPLFPNPAADLPYILHAFHQIIAYTGTYISLSHDTRSYLHEAYQKGAQAQHNAGQPAREKYHKLAPEQKTAHGKAEMEDATNEQVRICT
ncbi:hypothetical protein KSP39_PZI007926 [Platanthera zijinensis]|uniref:Uncharacterized protein n=1 Tax=Platanthera zijinensis TaxID=2320716 RepID=A0AAP0G8R8_9ASPA